MIHVNGSHVIYGLVSFTAYRDSLRPNHFSAQDIPTHRGRTVPKIVFTFNVSTKYVVFFLFLITSWGLKPANVPGLG